MPRGRVNFSPGRRVTIRDLVDAGLLQIGSEIYWNRPNVGEEYLASVDESGRIKLSDGRAYSAPSRAANEAVGNGSFDGWLAWRVSATGELLDRVRQRFLEQAEYGSDGAVEDLQATDAQAFLRQARERAEIGDPVTESVRGLLAHWHVESRDLAASDRIAADLENHGLSTVPNFLKVALDAPVELLLERLDESSESSGDTDDLSPKVAEEAIDVGITLGNLLDPEARLVSVTRESSLDEAITLMLLNDFSQLPVLAGARNLRGAITWQSIARAAHAKKPATVKAALVPCPLRSFEDELVDILGVLQDDDFVVVQDSTKQISGIITAADVVQKYGELATPFFLVGELDQYLRRIIRENFDFEEVSKVLASAGQEIKGFDQMTMGHYQAVLSNEELWKKLGWSLDRVSLMHRLDEMRKIRNDLVHFTRDKVSPLDVERLRRLIGVLKTYALE